MRRNTLNFTVDTLALIGMVAMAVTGLVIRYTLPPGTGGREGGRALKLWGLSRHGWGDVHFWIAVGIAAMLLLHVFLHWQWAWKTVLRFFSTPTRFRQHLSPLASKVWGLGFFLFVAAVIAAFVWFAQSSVQVVNAQRPIATDVAASQPVAAADAPEQVDAVEPKKAIGRKGPAEQSEGVGRNEAEGHDETEDHIVAGVEIRGSMTLRAVATATGVDVEAIKERFGIPSRVSSDEQLGRLKRAYGFELSELRSFLSSQLKSPSPAPSSAEGMP
ncbi:MAG TPA: DUF4405 domain-containing protein [Phycisphaerae bacterium]|nr:DUF4405 domain-containing protein [Phycisphaerae bacterium]